MGRDRTLRQVAGLGAQLEAEAERLANFLDCELVAQWEVRQ